MDVDLLEVEDGRVRLSGMVGSASEQRKAISDAHVDGVIEVKAGGLDIAFWERDERLRKHKYAYMTHETVARVVRAALRYDPRVDQAAVSVTVLDRTGRDRQAPGFDPTIDPIVQQLPVDAVLEGCVRKDA